MKRSNFFAWVMAICFMITSVLMVGGPAHAEEDINIETNTETNIDVASIEGCDIGVFIDDIATVCEPDCELCAIIQPGKSALTAEDGEVSEEGRSQGFTGEPDDGHFCVSYLDWNDNLLLHIHLYEGELIEKNECLIPERGGHTFEYWYEHSDEEDEEIEPYTFGHPLNGNLTLVAFYAPSIEGCECCDPLDGSIIECANAIIDSILCAVEECETQGIPDPDGDDCCVPQAQSMNGEYPPQRSVKIHSNAGDRVYEHDTITLHGELIGFDGCEYTLQWQVLTDGQWQDIIGANGREHSFLATEQSVYNHYRLRVVVGD